MAERRHLHRRADGEGPTGRGERRLGCVHDSAAPDPASTREPAAVRGHPRRRVLLRAGPAGVALAGGARDLRDREEDDVATTPTGTDRWKVLDFGPPPSDLAEPDQPVLVEYVAGERVARITLNRPHADNAITTEMGARLTEILETIAVRPTIRVAVITGAGDRAFSVGSDLRQRKDMTKEDWLRQRQDFDRTPYTLRQFRTPIFAAVNGVAYGGGSEIAQSTDFIIASENATFGQPESMIGLAAGGGSPALLPRLLPPGKALQMLMTGDPISAQEAYRLGMVNDVYPQGELMDAAHRIAEKIASNSPTAVQAVKRAVRMGEGQPIEQAIAIMMEAHWRSAVHPDRIEGIGAFNEDREPIFQDSDY
ncbi:MAG: enoyl-CoA hydratase [Actinobacteria bacterium]|nr:MAG: enoyl-CoA hydratase [Actinomycetota bacterium]